MWEWVPAIIDLSIQMSKYLVPNWLFERGLEVIWSAFQNSIPLLLLTLNDSKQLFSEFCQQFWQILFQKYGTITHSIFLLIFPLPQSQMSGYQGDILENLDVWNDIRVEPNLETEQLVWTGLTWRLEGGGCWWKTLLVAFLFEFLKFLGNQHHAITIGFFPPQRDLSVLMSLKMIENKINLNFWNSQLINTKPSQFGIFPLLRHLSILTSLKIVQNKITMTVTKPTWKAFYTNWHSYDDGNHIVSDFTNALNSKNEVEMIKALTKIQNSVIFTSDAQKKVALIHSPINLGGNRI